MNAERVQEILESKGVIDVNYNGRSIWIKSLDKSNKTAEIEVLNDNELTQTVDISELNEG